MRSYVIDELLEEHTEKFNRYLDSKGLTGALDGLYWLEMPESLLTELQKEHKDCGPHAVALEVNENSVHMELLVRGRNSMHCNCIAYCTQEQRSHMMNMLDTMLKELDIPV